MNEVSLVLKSVTILISALKEAQKRSTAESKLAWVKVEAASTAQAIAAVIIVALHVIVVVVDFSCCCV